MKVMTVLSLQTLNKWSSPLSLLLSLLSRPPVSSLMSSLLWRTSGQHEDVVVASLEQRSCHDRGYRLVVIINHDNLALLVFLVMFNIHINDYWLILLLLLVVCRLAKWVASLREAVITVVMCRVCNPACTASDRHRGAEGIEGALYKWWFN